MKFTKKKADEPPKAPEEEPEEFWTYLDTNAWTKICATNGKQSPIHFTGSRSEVNQEVHFFDIFPSPKPMPTKIELFDEGRILGAKGEFINFYTRRMQPELKQDGPIERVYRTYRMEIKSPCEHKSTNPCQLEFQFWANEEVDYTKGIPIDVRNQAVFSIMFTEQEVGVNFTDGFYVELGEKKEKMPFLNALKQQKEGVTKDSDIFIDIMDAFQKGQILPTDKKEKHQAFYYEGSKTHPTCDETVHWFVHGNLFGVSKGVVEQIKHTWLGNTEIFKDFSNNRLLKTNDVLSFYMVDLTYDAIRGQEEKAPMFVKRTPSPELKPTWGQHVLMATTTHQSQSMVIEAYETHFLIKKLEEEPKKVDKALGDLIYAQGNYVFGIKDDTLLKVNLTGDHASESIPLSAKDITFFVSSYHDDKNPDQFIFAYTDGDKLHVKDTKNKKFFLNNKEKLKLEPAERPGVKITSLAFSTNNAILAIGYAEGFVRILSFNPSGQIIESDWPEPRVLFDDNSPINQVVVKSSMVSAFNDKGEIAYATISQPSCGQNNFPDEEKKLGILKEKVEEEGMLFAASISDFQFFSISNNLLRLWDFDLRRLSISHKIQEGYAPLCNFGRVFEAAAPGADEESQAKKRR